MTNQTEPGLTDITICLPPETVDFLSWLKKKKKFHTIEEAAAWMIEDWADKFLERIEVRKFGLLTGLLHPKTQSIGLSAKKPILSPTSKTAR